MSHFCTPDECDPSLCTRNAPKKTSNTYFSVYSAFSKGCYQGNGSQVFTNTSESFSLSLEHDGRWSKLAIYSVVLINTAIRQQPTATARTCMQINMKGSSNSWATQQKTHHFSSTLCFWASPRESEEKREGQGPIGGGAWVNPQGKPRLLLGPLLTDQMEKTHMGKVSFALEEWNMPFLYWSWQDEAKTRIRETNFNALGLTGNQPFTPHWWSAEWGCNTKSTCWDQAWRIRSLWRGTLNELMPSSNSWGFDDLFGDECSEQKQWKKGG